MQIVIDMPESIYETIKEEEVGNVVYKAIKSGTPLPKGHGRLIDADKLISSFPNYDGVSDVAKTIDYAPTIIEVDSVESEEQGC